MITGSVKGLLHLVQFLPAEIAGGKGGWVVGPYGKMPLEAMLGFLSIR